HWSVVPYGAASNLAGESSSRMGLDARVTPSPAMTIDATLHPDFSQIEADVPQLSVNERFGLFYAEKRPFFLERKDLFDTELLAVHTRTVTDPSWGARVTGDVDRTSYTFLVANDRGGGLVLLPGTEVATLAPQAFASRVAVGRVRSAVGPLSAGAVLTDRQVQGGGHNVVLGPDLFWRLGKSDSVTVQYLVSDTRNPLLADVDPAWNGSHSRSHAAYAGWAHQSRSWDGGVEGTDIGSGFRADVGFIPQSGVRERRIDLGYRIWPAKGALRFLRLGAVYDRVADLAGDTVSRSVYPSVNLYGLANIDATIDYHGAESVRIEGHTIRQRYLRWTLSGEPSRKFAHVAFSGRYGELADVANVRSGHGATMTLSTTLQPVDSLTAALVLTRRWLDTPSAHERIFTADARSLRIDWNVTTRVQVRAIAQQVETRSDRRLYRDEIAARDGFHLGSLLFSYRLSWQTALYLGYDDRRLVTDDVVGPPDTRKAYVKLSYMFGR
ncbi:MAG TPA: DUF5916 domain-containing protein, partial [Thermoanaerobaculia bacterium]|nr:DUF5916 domain-containing protein [Thermoanaerobaculia bacterium]